MATIEQQMRYMHLLAEGAALEFYCLRRSLSDGDWIELYNAFERGNKMAGKKQAAELEQAGVHAFKECIAELRNMMEQGDEMGMRQILDDLSPTAYGIVAAEIGLAEQEEVAEEAPVGLPDFDMSTPF